MVAIFSAPARFVPGSFTTAREKLTSWPITPFPATFVPAGFSHVERTSLTLGFSETPMQEGSATMSSIVYTEALALAK